MSEDNLSRIETMTTNSDEDASVSSLDAISIQANGAVNLLLIDPLNESTIPGNGFWKAILSIGNEHCAAICEAFHGSCLLKIKGFLMCILFPFSIILTPFKRSRNRRSKMSNIAIVYFYVIMASTIVLNLWVQQGQHNKSMAKKFPYRFLQYFEAVIMVLTLIAMLCIAYETYGQVEWRIHERRLVLYFRTGLYVFGISSMVYSSLIIYNTWSCDEGLVLFVNLSKFIFIAGQILFLNYFYQAKLPPSSGRMYQLSLAHIMATNLSLWIWVVCKEVYDPYDESRKSKKLMDCQAIHLNNTAKYFYPLFIEYLLIVAGMMYELWSDMKTPYQTKRRAIRLRHTEENHDRESVTDSNDPVRLISSGRRHRWTSSLGLTFMIAVVLCCVFVSFVLASETSAARDKKWYLYYIWANIVIYISQIASCYAIKVCSQSQPFNSKQIKLNLDDSLLYFGLAGIVVWNGFHFYRLVLHVDTDIEAVEVFNNVLSIFEDFAQTVILVSVRRLSSKEDGNAQTIKNMSLFLLATNLTFWFQNSFYIEKELINPGENSSDLLNTYADILNPLIIFFRFHSATCCYQMWVIFSSP
ncbi:uncharacterized protein LOC124446908 [Xenia sp. Carnegie-2017]|uniref:uncharacterized protein LOC124446908 n=1 Tax=Xenia sp. Carnegie-2017 TaxID=2897299 RepID=UPI001F04A523|nr:uncharacterized protein LOC124446908 [Xenia sp. Carnegie-2017]